MDRDNDQWLYLPASRTIKRISPKNQSESFLGSEASYEDICNTVKAASESGAISETLAYTDEKVVSTDFRGVGYSSIFDAGAGIALDGTFVKLVSWYDNEYGYTCNMMRFVRHVAKN